LFAANASRRARSLLDEIIDHLVDAKASASLNLAVMSLNCLWASASASAARGFEEFCAPVLTQTQEFHNCLQKVNFLLPLKTGTVACRNQETRAPHETPGDPKNKSK
jgi:hypothetical protein